MAGHNESDAGVLTLLMVVMMMGGAAGGAAGGATDGATDGAADGAADGAVDVDAGVDAGGAAGGASGTKRKASAIPSDDPPWPAPGDEGRGSMHNTFDRIWTQCKQSEKPHERRPFFIWYRLVKDWYLNYHKNLDEGPDESDPEWKKFWIDRRNELIRRAKYRLGEDATDDAIKRDVVKLYQSTWHNYPNW